MIFEQGHLSGHAAGGVGNRGVNFDEEQQTMCGITRSKGKSAMLRGCRCGPRDIRTHTIVYVQHPNRTIAFLGTKPLNKVNNTDTRYHPPTHPVGCKPQRSSLSDTNIDRLPCNMFLHTGPHELKELLQLSLSLPTSSARPWPLPLFRNSHLCHGPWLLLKVDGVVLKRNTSVHRGRHQKHDKSRMLTARENTNTYLTCP